jgi:hypothetical protein
MQARIEERVESWGSRPFTGGVRQLHELADADFSGAVSVGGTWLFLLNGRVIGVFGGDVEDVADADGTVYEAPHESVALLYAMQERGGETQAKYYTNDTPLSEASETLSDANFTGYIELSENVLSGDYYVVYYGGRSMSAAFVGTSEELVTGDEAFERADDEVGVYEVMKTPVSVTELPQLDDEEEAQSDSTGATAGASAATGAGAASAADDDDDDDLDDSEAESDAGSTALSTGDTSASRSDTSASTTETNASRDDGSDPGRQVSDAGRHANDSTGESASDGAGASNPSAGATEDGTDGDAQSASTGSENPTADADASTSSSGAAGTSDGSSSSGGPRTSASGHEAVAAKDGGTTTEDGEKAFDEEREWRKTTSVPTIDPDDSEGGDGDNGSAGSTSSKSSKSSKSSASSKASRSAGQTPGGSRKQSRSSRTGGQSTVEKLKQAVKQREQKLQAASERIDSLEGERDDLEERVDRLESERDDLESEISSLESELAALEASDDDGDEPSGEDLNAVDALSGTNLFVRYDSKGQPTLDELDDATDPEAVNENLRIDHHTQFDAETATVNGEPFASYLHGTTVYRFVSWAVRALPFEVRDSGHRSGLADLYEALPRIDRAELNGTVEVEPDEDTSVSRTFDVVLRDRMGNPLVVADVATGRDPVTGDQMNALVSDATAIREGSDDLSAAMYVTGSFFEPAALETADEATSGGGFLSRSDRESFVKVGRKSGYHLCLVEDRNDAFHLTVPEL